MNQAMMSGLVRKAYKILPYGQNDKKTKARSISERALVF